MEKEEFMAKVKATLADLQKEISDLAGRLKTLEEGEARRIKAQEEEDEW